MVATVDSGRLHGDEYDPISFFDHDVNSGTTVMPPRSLHRHARARGSDHQGFCRLAREGDDSVAQERRGEQENDSRGQGSGVPFQPATRCLKPRRRPVSGTSRARQSPG